MTKRHISVFLGKAFLNSVGISSAIITTALSLLAYFGIDSSQKVSLKILLIILLVTLYIILILIRFAWIVYTAGFPKLPAVKQGTKDRISNLALLVLEPSELFSFGSMVAVYFIEDQFERLIGLGKVSNVQDNGMIQISILQQTENEQDLWDKITGNQADKIKHILVKPHFPSELMEYVK